MVVRWLALSRHSKKVLGLNRPVVWGLSLWRSHVECDVFSPDALHFLAHAKDMQGFHPMKVGMEFLGIFGCLQESSLSNMGWVFIGRLRPILGIYPASVAGLLENIGTGCSFPVHYRYKAWCAEAAMWHCPLFPVISFICLYFHGSMESSLHSWFIILNVVKFRLVWYTPLKTSLTLY